MGSNTEGTREGSLGAPTRHALDWKNPQFYQEQNLFAELERVFDICHGCRRCFSLCNAFPTLFDAIDESDSNYPVYCWDHNVGFDKRFDDFDAFTKHLVTKLAK